MAMMPHARKSGAVVLVGVLVAWLGSDGAAQSVRQVQPRQVDRVSQRVPLPESLVLPELVLLPEPVPLPMQVPLPTQVSPQPQDQATPPPPAQPPDQLPPTQQAPHLAQARLPQQTLPSEQTGPPQLVRLVELASPTPPSPSEVGTFEMNFSATDYPPPNPAISTKDHPAVGSWFGMAIQVCPDGVAPSACAFGNPALAIFMTPTITDNGLFFGDDSSTIVEPPYGPHTTAYGVWTPTSATEFTTEYVFMTRPFPPQGTDVTSGVRARWVAKVIDEDTIVGWVNAYFLDPAPIKWRALQTNEFPVIPSEALPFHTAPNGFIQDPLQCVHTGCPLVLKFTINRVKR